MKRIVISAALIFLLSIAASCCPSTSTPTPTPTGTPTLPNGGGDGTQAYPDLVVSHIDVYTHAPQAGMYQYDLVVYVANQGQAQSGDFDLVIFTEDIGRGLTYPIGTFRVQQLNPGDDAPVYSSTHAVNNPGSYQVHVEIIPFNFEDGNTQNNYKIWAFTTP